LVVSGERLGSSDAHAEGKIRVENPFTWVERAVEQMREAPLTNEIVRIGLAMPLPHADPADRFLAATAKSAEVNLGYG